MLKQYSFLVYAKYIITVCQLHRYSFLIHYSCLFSGVLLSGYDVCITRFTVQQLPHYNKTLQLPSLRPPPPPLARIQRVVKTSFLLYCSKFKVTHAEYAQVCSLSEGPVKSITANQIVSLCTFLIRKSHQWPSLVPSPPPQLSSLAA